MIGYFVIGILIGAIGAANNWSLIRTFATAFGVAILVSLIFQKASDANELPYEKLRPTTIHIAVGTGSVVEAKSGKHYLLTNWHVCQAGSWKGTIAGSTESGVLYTGKIVKLDAQKDLCAGLLDQAGPALQVAKEFVEGEDLWTRGYPQGVLTESHGVAKNMSRWTFEFPIDQIGECPSQFRKDYDPRGVLIGCVVNYYSLITSLYSRPGSSGSPVVDSKGDLVALVSSWHTDRKYEAGCVGFDDLKDFMKGL